MRRAVPASDWQSVRKGQTAPVDKSVSTTDALAESGKVPPAQSSTRAFPGQRVKMPPVDDTADNTEAVSLPRKKCNCSDVSKCNCSSIKDEEKHAEKAADGNDHTAAHPDGPGVMVALMAPLPIAKKLAQPNGTPEDEMHVTLGYYGRLGKDITPAQVDAIQKCVAKLAEGAKPIKAAIGGIGRFNGTESSDNKDVLVGLVDSPDLHDLRDAVIEEVYKCSGVVKSDDQPGMPGLRPRRNHGYTPHITMAYVEPDAQMTVHKLDRDEFTFTTISVVVGGEQRAYMLGEKASSMVKTVSIVKSDEDQRLATGIVLQPEVVDAQGDIYSADVIKSAAHNFLAKYNSKTQLGLQHEIMKPDGVELVESWITPVDMAINGREIRAGTWMMTVRVHNDALWTKIKTGQISGFSIGGVARVRQLAA